MIGHPLWRGASWLLIAALAAAGAYAITVDTVEGLVLLGLAVLGGTVVTVQRAFPSWLMLLLLVTATINAAGYILGLWHERTLFDEIVHAFTTFVGITALMWVAAPHLPVLGRASAPALIGIALFTGLGLGLVWEGFEWLIGIIGSRRDTLVDLGMDSLGAIAAGLLFSACRDGRQ